MSSCYSVKTVPKPDGRPKGPTVVLDTIVEVPTEPPKDHILWSFLCFTYLNPLCLGLAALICSIKARDRKAAGDLKGARRPGCIAFWLNVVATVLVVLLIIALIVSDRYSYIFSIALYRKIWYNILFAWF